ncbi:brachyurin-like [Ochlerotatus camptorhynchus]|uniref:brachyurin-like n=1 Tax=Ochlerotatus camptorhynchus TaxID=644619 RepID=UPI0031CEACB3
MKISVVLLIGVAAVTAAAEIDWSKVRPIEDFDHYWARLPQELQSLRYSVPSSRITNGNEARPGQFPYQVALVINLDQGSALCGASIISNDYILTAAHCVIGALGGTALLGAHNRLNNEPSQQSIVFEADGITIHPEYTANTIRNDVALIRLTNSIEFNERVQPVGLPSRQDGRTFSGMMGTVSGFGRTSDTSSSTSPVVRFAINPIITFANCLDQWNNAMHVIQPQNICLSGNGGRSSCNGDSGGPLTVQDNGESLLVGIVSFGSSAGCAIGRPSVYVRVTHFLDWILENSDVEA